jgi:hypothetical protein
MFDRGSATRDTNKIQDESKKQYKHEKKNKRITIERHCHTIASCLMRSVFVIITVKCSSRGKAKETKKKGNTKGHAMKML